MRVAKKYKSWTQGFLLLALLSPVEFLKADQAKSDPVKTDSVAYRPVDADAWNSSHQLIRRSKFANVFNARPSAKAQTSTALGSEWKLLLAEALDANKQNLLAQLLLMDVASNAVGTAQGSYALVLLNRIAKESIMDEDALEALAFDLDTTIDDSGAKMMVDYFKGRALLRRGFSKWALQSIASIEAAPDSTWGAELTYDHALQSLQAGDSTAAFASFDKITKNEQVRKTTAMHAELDRARMIFERSDFKSSLETYQALKVSMRDRAHALNETAWAYYYDQQYGKALGVIRALKSPYFRALISPESYMLEMLIYRKLCQYQKLRNTANEFQDHYASVFKAVESRKPLDDVRQLNEMILQKGVVQKRASVIQEYRAETAVLRKQKWADENLKKWLLASELRRENAVDQFVQSYMHSRLDETANWFLDLREQVWFLDYDASIRLAQLRDSHDPNYQPPEKDEFKVETLFWPVNDEAWLDEIPDYEVLIKSSCRGDVPGASN